MNLSFAIIGLQWVVGMDLGPLKQSLPEWSPRGMLDSVSSRSIVGMESAHGGVMSKRNVVIQSDVFGPIFWNKELKRYSAVVGSEQDAIGINFQVDDVDALEDLVAQASKLWRRKGAWFTNWCKRCYDFYGSELKDAWYDGEEPLDFVGFKKRLGMPAGIDFALEDGALSYLISVTSEDLVGDHFIEAVGCDLDPTDFALT